MILAPPAPPAIEQPSSYQVSYGLVAGRAAAGTKRVIVRVGAKTLADLPLRQREFQLHVDLPAAETTVTVITVGATGRRARASVDHVLGASRASAPRLQAPRSDPMLASKVLALARSFGDTCAIYVQNLGTGAGAAWNAKATFPAASTLKLAIAVTALARSDETPARGSTLDGLLRTMLTYSDNAAANGTERYFGGSTSGGSSLVNGLMQSVGLVDTDMYGGYDLDDLRVPQALAGPIPLRVDREPSWGRGKRTSAYDLSSLLRDVWLASGGLGALRTAQPGFTPADSRYLLYLLAGVRDPGKIDREIGGGPGVRVLHKAGWIGSARHDNGIVLWPGGALLVTVMTYRPGGVGVSSDILAGRAAATALQHFRK